MATPYSTVAGGDEVLLNTVNNAGVITLNRPKSLNALNLKMIRIIMPQMVVSYLYIKCFVFLIPFKALSEIQFLSFTTE